MTQTRRLHLANAAQRDATVVAVSVAPPPEPVMGYDGRPVQFRRYVAAGPGRLNEDLSSTFGEDYAQALVDGDPEIDMENVGRFIKDAGTVLVASSGEPMFAAPAIVEVTYAPDGAETQRGTPVDVAASVNDVWPARWTGRKVSKADAVRKFVFRRTLQLRHVDGLTYDYLHAMAKELAEADAMVLIGGGGDGKKPLILQVNGSPYRGFLEGRVDGDRYLLLLHLSNMELKRPADQDAGKV